LENYLNQFPEGGFVLSAYNYLSICYEKVGDTNKSLSYFEKIIAFPENQYTDIALLKAARIEFERKNYPKAYEYYLSLHQLAEDPGMQLEATDGAMRGAFLKEDYASASRFAGEMLESPIANESQILMGWYILAKSSYQTGNRSEAERGFQKVDQLTSGEMGAEAKYYLALFSFERNALDEAENLIYELPDQYPDFEYWIAKGFILLADIYVKRDNTFQAEQTLLSVIDNYPGDDLKEEARLKLEKIKPEEVTEPSEEDEEIEFE
jgi:TolA-binding protein